MSSVWVRDVTKSRLPTSFTILKRFYNWLKFQTWILEVKFKFTQSKRAGWVYLSLRFSLKPQPCWVVVSQIKLKPHCVWFHSRTGFIGSWLDFIIMILINFLGIPHLLPQPRFLSVEERCLQIFYDCHLVYYFGSFICNHQMIFFLCKIMILTAMTESRVCLCSLRAFNFLHE